jgi:hypothetical protein
MFLTNQLDSRRVLAKCLFLEKLNLDLASDRSLYFYSIFPGILFDLFQHESLQR